MAQRRNHELMVHYLEGEDLYGLSDLRHRARLVFGWESIEHV